MGLDGRVQINLFLILFLVLFGIRSLLQVVLNNLNRRHRQRQKGQIPRVFNGLVSKKKLNRIDAYTLDSARFGSIVSLFNQSLMLVVVLSGFLPSLVTWLTGWISSPVGGGLLFFATLWLIFHVSQIPFSVYETFVIEERHGFNTKTPRIWVFDLLKETILSIILGGIVLALLLILINSVTRIWWIWAWIGLGIFEGLILWLYPVLIAPWFNKFDPIADRALERRIRDLLDGVGVSVKGIFQMDAGKRTRHTNAYFTGLGRTKRIVLFDSLLKAHSHNEILAILSHEMGHWKRRHIIKQLVLLETVSLGGLFVVARLLDWPLLYQTFGFREPIAFVGLFLVSPLMGLAGYFSRPLTSAVSRRFERQADDAVLEIMGTTAFLTQALRKLALDNLANLNPHPLFAWFSYSHPPVVQRIERLERIEKGRRPDEAESATI
jgi:STE24 endopeptidase